MNNLRERIIVALESDVDFKGKKALKIIHDTKEQSRKGFFICSHATKSSGFLTPPNYHCIPFSQCEKCGEYFFSIDFIEKILENFNQEKNIHARN